MPLECEPDDWPSKPGRQPCLWFYVFLPQCLPLPEGYQTAQAALPEEMYLHVAVTELRYLVRVLQQRSPSQLLSGMHDVLTAVNRVVGEPPPERPDYDAVPDGLVSTVTILEVCVPASPEAPPGDVEAALDVAIEAVRNLQSVVSTVSRRAFRLISRSSLPPLIHVATGEIVQTDAGTHEERDDDLLLHTVDGGQGASHYGLAPEQLSDEQMETLGIAANVLGRGTAYADYADLRRELSVQLHHDGNDRIAVVIAATAAEVLLDTTLLHLLWHEHVEPVDAAAVFDRSIRHQARVTTYLPPRLLGDWDPNGNGPVGEYFTKVANLRNRVVHTGFVPSREEALAAEAALGRLEAFIGDRLASNEIRNQYPRTAMALLGKRGLENRSAYTRRIQKLSDDPNEPDWIEAFKRYRHIVDLRSRGELRAPGTVAADLELYVEVPGMKFVAYDRPVLMAAEAPDGEQWLTDRQRADLPRIVEVMSEGDAGRIRFFLDEDRTAPDLDWRPETELIPELTMWPGTRTAPPRGGQPPSPNC